MDQGAVGTAKADLPASLNEYDFVRLRRDLSAGGSTYPAGTRGVVVHRHADRAGYEVEFETPAFRVLTVMAHDLMPDHA